MRRIKWWIITLLWMLMIWWLSNQPNLSSGLEHDLIWRKMAHIFEYAVLTWLLFRATGWRGKGVGVISLVIVMALVYASLDEWHQTWVVGRYGTGWDVGIDGVGVTLTFLWLQVRLGRISQYWKKERRL